MINNENGKGQQLFNALTLVPLLTDVEWEIVTGSIHPFISHVANESGK